MQRTSAVRKWGGGSREGWRAVGWSGGFTAGSPITEHGQTPLNVFEGNEEGERAKGGTPHGVH